MYDMPKKLMTFKHWKTSEIRTIESREADVPANPNSERLVVWNETEQKLEDVIKSTIVEIRGEYNAKLLSASHFLSETAGSLSTANKARSLIR